jgi:hypothetical protein
MSKSEDLNIDNYDLNDILALFKITPDFNEDDLKAAKKIVLKTHPDKSGLASEYFLFYSKAYKVLFSVWEFKNKSKKDIKPEEFSKSDTFFDKQKKKTLDDFLSKENLKDQKSFNKWFNSQFEKNKTDREDDATGYGDWLKSDEDIEEVTNIHYSQIGEEIEKKKKHLQSLIVHEGVNELQFNYQGATSLTDSTPCSYGSDIFSNLKYEDLRKAHTETVIPVTMEDYNNIKKFRNVNEYNTFRNTQNTTPLSEIQAREYLSNKSKLEETDASNRAFKLAKQTEESQKKQDKYWANMRTIENPPLNPPLRKVLRR